MAKFNVEIEIIIAPTAATVVWAIYQDDHGYMVFHDVGPIANIYGHAQRVRTGLTQSLAGRLSERYNDQMEARERREQEGDQEGREQEQEEEDGGDGDG